MLFMTVFSPLTNLMYSARNFMVNNPLTQARLGLQSARQQLNYFTGLPRHFTRLILPPGLANKIKIPGLGKLNLGGADEGDQAKDEKDLPEDISRGRKVKSVPRRAQFSQIHLIEQGTDTRHVLHIGSVVGQSASDIKLEHPVYGQARLRFSQINPKEYKNAPMLLSYLSGETALEVHGAVTRGSTPIYNYDVISIGGVNYDIELYAYDRLPVLTRVDAAWATTSGPRDVNEDSIGIYQHNTGYMFVVADGVGGGYAGEEVSTFAAQYALRTFEKNLRSNIAWTTVLHKAYTNINAEVRRFFVNSPHPSGTTLTSAIIKNWQAHIAHVGDSAIFLYRNYTLERLTADHSENQQIGYETIDGDEQPATRSMLQKAIGKADTITPDVFAVQIQPGDKLLFCSDGLSTYVPHVRLLEALELPRVTLAVKKLIELAYEHETKDNVSVIVVDVLEEPYERDSWVARPDERVYVNGRFPMVPRLKKPREMNTIYSFMTSWGCLAWVLILFACGLLYGAYRTQPVMSTAAPQVTADVTAESDSTAEADATAEVTAGATEEAQTPETAAEEETVIPTLEATREPTNTFTPAPTQPPAIRPTSTLRAPR